jgi:hypothetical protein
LNAAAYGVSLGRASDGNPVKRANLIRPAISSLYARRDIPVILIGFPE